MIVRTRFAPSPTGSLHMGGARTALYNYLLAKRFGGTFILRIEDTDAERSSLASQNKLLDELKWLGLHWDEGPTSTQTHKGNFGPYSQSMRFATYQKHADMLLENGNAFYCFSTEEDIEAQRANTPERHTFKFVSPYRDWPLDKAKSLLESGKPAVVRFRNQHDKDIFHVNDLVRGDIELPGHMIGDFVLLRADGSPVYNFCCAIDDALMQITHVLRGEEHLPNTLRQMMIFSALGLEQPQYGHLSLILDTDGKKLSKRTGASSVSDFQALGFIPEGLLNYFALLGWSDPDHREILTLNEMIEVFSTERLNPAAPMYDPDKLRWVNFKHLHNYSTQDLWHLSQPFIVKAGLDLPTDPSWSEKAMTFFQQDFHTLEDSVVIFTPFTLSTPRLDDEAMSILQWEDTQRVIFELMQQLYTYAEVSTSDRLNTLTELVSTLTKGKITSLRPPQAMQKTHSQAQIREALSSITLQDSDTCLTEEAYTTITQHISKSLTVKGKFLFKPIRVAFTASANGPDLKRVIALVSLSRLIERVEYALLCYILLAQES